MAFTLFDLMPGDRFLPMMDNNREVNLRVASHDGVVDTYFETTRFETSKNVVQHMLKQVNVHSPQFNTAYVISFDGKYVGGDLADNYHVNDILVAWANDLDMWFISTFSKKGG